MTSTPPGPDPGPSRAPEGEDTAGAVFAALADPTRRAVLAAVAARGRATATDLRGDVGVSRQAVAKHLDLLATAGLVVDHRDGRERRWRVTPGPLRGAAAWLETTGAAWDRRLTRLSAAARGGESDDPVEDAGRR